VSGSRADELAIGELASKGAGSEAPTTTKWLRAMVAVPALTAVDDDRIADQDRRVQTRVRLRGDVPFRGQLPMFRTRRAPLSASSTGSLEPGATHATERGDRGDGGEAGRAVQRSVVDNELEDVASGHIRNE
jgi:hypothetical protein